jgi:hypothetical protein
MGATNGFPKLRGSYRDIFYSLLRSVHGFPGGFRKAICSSDGVLEQLLRPKQESLGKFMKIPKHFA